MPPSPRSWRAEVECARPPCSTPLQSGHRRLSADEGAARRLLRLGNDVGSVAGGGDARGHRPAQPDRPSSKFPDGTLAMSIETNKNYEDPSRWMQRVTLRHSRDMGQTWSAPLTASQDPTGRIFNWDQRAGSPRTGGWRRQHLDVALYV